ncbi:MAG: putative toxin-antitoxin system toxin component, PIN family [Aggregatilineales bacterium]
MKIVIDTNVLISAVIRRNPTIRAVLDACRTGEVVLVLSKPLLRELGRVLHKPNLQKLHRMTDAEISEYITALSTFAEIVPGTTKLEVSKDPLDNIFFACAVEAQADYIVSGDVHHILSVPSFQGVKTISPTDFVEKILHAR